jgi:putative zinc finger/helix-turn-helix YgiT family protein
METEIGREEIAMTECRECGGPVRVEQIERYVAENELQAMGVVIAGAASRRVCEACGLSSIVIPDLPGLLAAVAVYRATIPVKLQGHEIKFMRKSMEVSAKELAELLEVSQETVSRWENDRAPMGSANEKLLRLMTLFKLAEHAPGVHARPGEVSRMKVPAVSEPGKKLTMTMSYVQALIDKDKVLSWPM